VVVVRLPDWFLRAILVAAFAFYFWRKIRFLLQGRWFRRLDPAQQAALIESDESWGADHGRPMGRDQLLGALIGILVVVIFVIWRDLLGLWR
jgi:hypothetical protein